MQDIDIIVEKIKKIIDEDMLFVEKRIAEYVSEKIIKDNLPAYVIKNNLREMPNFEYAFTQKYSNDIGALGLDDDDYVGIAAAGFDIDLAIYHALEDISVVVGDAVARAEVFAKTAAVSDVFGENSSIYWRVAKKAWQLAESAVGGHGIGSKVRVIELYIDILSLMRDAKDSAIRNLG